jgi:hypothetical protein
MSDGKTMQINEISFFFFFWSGKFRPVRSLKERVYYIPSLKNLASSTSKNTLFSLLCLCLLFNKIRDKGRTGSAWK